MTYEELKNFAQPYIREGSKLPSNAFLLLNQLGITFKNEVQCEADYGGKMTPLYNHPAFLAKKNGEKIIYFNSTTKYWNFYLFHEIAHYLLDHEDDSAQNEADANMLACILAAPVENLPTTLKTARDISCLCNIPIDKAEEYWQEIRPTLKPKYKFKKPILLSFAIVFSVTAIVCTYSFICTIASNRQNAVIDTVYVTQSGAKYHAQNCIFVRDKKTVINLSVDEAIRAGYSPCSICIGK